MQNNAPYGTGMPPMGTPLPAPPPPLPRPSFEIGKKDCIFTVCALVLSVAGVSLTLWGGFKLGFTLSLVLLFVLGTAYLTGKGTKLKPYAVLCAILALAGSAVFSLSANAAVNFVLLPVLFVLLAVWFDSLNGDRREIGDMGLLRNVFSSTFKNGFGYAPQAVFSVFGNQKSATLKPVLLGIVCAAPVLFVVLPLLVSSDAAFEGLISHLFGNLSATIFKLLLGIALTPLLMGYCFAQKKLEKPLGTPLQFSGIPALGVSSFLGSISLCYLTYLFSQLVYFISAFQKILPDGFTVAQYARRGFFEMAVIAAINFVLVFAALLLARKNDGKTPLAVKLFAAFISLFTLVIIGTALSKMVLYIDSFGMTPLRILTSAFMVALGVTFVALLVRCFTPRIPVIRIALVTSAVVLLTLGLGNMDKRIADYNVTAYQTGKLETVDMRTLYSLGCGGVPALDTLTQSEDETVAQQAQFYVRKNIDRYYHCTEDEYRILTFTRCYTGFDKWNLTRDNTYAILDTYLADYLLLPEQSDMPLP